MDYVIVMKFGQNVQNKILLTYLWACLAKLTTLEVILEKPEEGQNLLPPPPPAACLGLKVKHTVKFLRTGFSL